MKMLFLLPFILFQNLTLAGENGISDQVEAMAFQTQLNNSIPKLLGYSYDQKLGIPIIKHDGFSTSSWVEKYFKTTGNGRDLFVAYVTLKKDGKDFYFKCVNALVNPQTTSKFYYAIERVEYKIKSGQGLLTTVCEVTDSSGKKLNSLEWTPYIFHTPIEFEANDSVSGSSSKISGNSAKPAIPSLSHETKGDDIQTKSIIAK